LCDWWRGGGRGVCALVGIGGAGKTAISDRFLRVLPGAMEQEPGLEKDDFLKSPDAIFVFSFYNAPNTEQFFDELYKWLVDAWDVPDRRPRTKAGGIQRASVSLVADALVRLSQRFLLVLDGLEKVQDDGARDPNAFGRIMDGGLRSFVAAGVEGRLRGISLLITTRFRLCEMEAFAYKTGSQLFLPINIERMTVESCVSLLRARGVSKGTDDDLRRLAEAQGFHALTVSLMGGYVAAFHNGDPRSIPPEPLEKPREVKQSAPFASPAQRYLEDQERRFARVAERYREGFKKSDPAALALLERLCLFRLGVDADLLSSVFLGEGRERISGPQLAAMKREELELRLQKLKAMDLIEATTKPNIRNEQFSVHPAIRDGFLSGLDQDIARVAHEAVGKEIERTLEEKRTDFLVSPSGDYLVSQSGDRLLSRRPGEKNPSDPAVLDLLEEIIYHTLESGHPKEAWDIYCYRIGRYRNLLWRLGDYQRGERICRSFAAGRPPDSAPLPKGLSKNFQAIWINEWGLYLDGLGRPIDATVCYERMIESYIKRKDWKNASIGQQNRAGALLLAGRLAEGLEAAEKALDFAERANVDLQRIQSHAYRGHARGLRGDVDAALDDFHLALEFQHKNDGKTEDPLYGLQGVFHTSLLSRLGRSDEARRLTEENKKILLSELGEQGNITPSCNLILSDIARERGDLNEASALLDKAHAWALARDAKEPLCWSALVHARIDLSALSKSPDLHSEIHIPHSAFPNPHYAFRNLDDGLRIARECGYGIYHIDLLIERARLNLLLGDAEAAERDARTALYGLEKVASGPGCASPNPYDAPALDEDSKPEDRGIFPPKELGKPDLYAATHPECGYAWGEAAGRHVLAEALLLRAAKGDSRAEDCPPRRALSRAEKELKLCIFLRQKIQDPKVTETLNVMEQLKKGNLTPYPIHEKEKPMNELISTISDDSSKSTPRDQVFISYSHKDQRWLDDLLIRLKPYLRSGAITPW